MSRAVLLVLGVLIAALVTAATVMPADAAPTQSATGEVCDLVAADTVALLRQVPLVHALAGGNDFTPGQITAARDHLHCGAPKQRSEAEARAVLCASLTVDGLDKLLAATNASQRVRGAVAAVPRNTLDGALSAARSSLNCGSSSGTTTPPPPADLDCGHLSQADAQRILDADPADPHHLDRDADGRACEATTVTGGQVHKVPVGSVDTGDGSTLR